MQLTGLLLFNATSTFQSDQELCYPLVYVVYINVENMANYFVKVPCFLRPLPGEHGQLLREERPVKVACATSHKVGIIVKLSLVAI